MMRSLSLYLLFGLPALAQIPAFPGAEGYGAYATGGRGGDVYHVTNLNSSGAGSFFDAISTVPSSGRTIVFDVSGYIRLPSGSSGTRLTSSKVTIAGQTAPGDGIGFYNNFFRISGDDIVLRHLRFRHGKYGSGGDCIDLDSGCLNAMLDHVSLQFSTDENISSYSSPPENLTLQYSLNSWGLESHSCGGLWDQNHATSHHNLWSHNHTRNPKARPNGLLEWVNNVTFDWDIGFIMGDSQSNQNWKSNVINNYFLCPPGNTHSKALVKGTVGDNGKPNFTVFLSGNLSDYDGDGLLNGTDKGYSIVEGTAHPPGTTGLTPGAAGYYQATSAIAGSTAGVTTDAPLLAYKKVVSNAGALRLDSTYAGNLRDEVDTILVSKLTTQTRFHVSRESDTGAGNSGFGTLNSIPSAVDSDKDGMPDHYETALGWNVATDDHNTVLASSGGLISGTTFFPNGTVAGYTRLEEYLHYLAIPHGLVSKNISGSPTSLTVDLRKYTSGFSDSPGFTVANVSGGVVALSGTGNAIATFTPTLNYSGRARFDFTVTDNSGLSWTQTFAVLVTASGLPRDLQWKGSGNTWDESSLAWKRVSDQSTVAFSTGDRVRLDDAGIAQSNVTVSGNLSPSTVDVDAAGNYKLLGTGQISSVGTLTKRGSGNLTIANSESYTNGVSIEAGGLILQEGASLAGGALSLLDGVSVTNGFSANNTDSIGVPISVPSGHSATFHTGNRVSLSGALTGGGTLNCNVQTTVSRVDFKGQTAAFAGNLNFTNAGGVRLFFNGFSFNGFDNSSVDIGGSVSLQPQTNSGGNTLNIGALSGTSANANLAGGTAGAVAIVIGGKGTSTSYAGSITGNATLTKTGAGSLTLGGANTYTGATTVSAGALRVNGSLGTSATTVAGGAELSVNGSAAGTVTVQSGARLSGTGTISALVTSQSGGSVSPGATDGAVATLTTSGGLNATSNTMVFDLSASPGGANDKILVSGNSGYLAGTNTFQINMADGVLGSGSYNLIECAAGIPLNIGGGMVMNLATSAPSGIRQSFSLNRTGSGTSGGYVRLTVTNDAASLVWTGANSGMWDWNSSPNWNAGQTFYNLDAVTFNDTAATGAVSLSGSLLPRAMAFNNNSLNYTLDGDGSIAGNASLIKSGSGSLTLGNSGANTFGGGTTIGSGGTIILADSVANATGLGTGAVTFNGGTLTMAGFTGSNSVSYDPMPNDLIVPTGQTGTLNLTQRAPKPTSANIFPAVNGSLSGGGTLNLVTKFVRGDVQGDWSAFTGTLNVVPGDGDGGDFRFGTSYSWSGMPAALVNLNSNTSAYFVGTLSSGAGTTVEIGALSGSAGSYFLGGPTSGRALTYRIGGRGTTATFAGTFAEQVAGSTLTNITKTGTGTWTLSGGGGWAGGTAVEQGTLEVSGNISSAGAVNVSNTATLKLTNGTLTTDAVTVDAGGSLHGYGTLSSDLNVNGSLETRGFASGTPGTLTVHGSAFLDGASLTRMRAGVSSDLLAVDEDIALGGTIQVSLASGSGFGRYPLMTCQGELAGSAALSGIPGGTSAHLSASVAGRLDLVVDDEDEDGLPDTWENQHLGGLASGPDDDDDGDGTCNWVEYKLGLDPANASSAFRATLSGHTIVWPSASGVTFQVLRSLSLDAGSWHEVASVVGGPGATASFTDPSVFDRAFYQIQLTP